MKKGIIYSSVWIIIIVLGLSTCSSTPKNSAAVIVEVQTKSKMYADILGFNDDVILSFGSGRSQRMPHDLETEVGVNKLISEIRAMPSGANTAAFYALDIGLDRIDHVRCKLQRDRAKCPVKNDPLSQLRLIHNSGMRSTPENSINC